MLFLTVHLTLTNSLIPEKILRVQLHVLGKKNNVVFPTLIYTQSKDICKYGGYRREAKKMLTAADFADDEEKVIDHIDKKTVQ